MKRKRKAKQRTSAFEKEYSRLKTRRVLMVSIIELLLQKALHPANQITFVRKPAKLTKKNVKSLIKKRTSADSAVSVVKYLVQKAIALRDKIRDRFNNHLLRGLIS